MHIKLHAAALSLAFIIFITTAIQDRMRILASAAMSKNDWQEGERRQSAGALRTFYAFLSRVSTNCKNTHLQKPAHKTRDGGKVQEEI